MKVVLIGHTCMSRTAGQPKLHCLAAYADIDLTALVPQKMMSYGEVKFAEIPENPPFHFVAAKVHLDCVMNQWHLMYFPTAVGRLLREVQPDVVNIWTEPWSLTAAHAIAHVRKICPRAKIVQETEQNIYRKLPFPFSYFQRYSIAHADLMVARSREAGEVLRLKGYRGPIRVVPNAVDCSLFSPLTAEERLAVRERLGWGTADHFVMGYVGRLVPEKGISDAVLALKKLPARVRLAIVGTGPERAHLEELTANAGLSDRVFFAGSRPFTELPELMNAMDTLVLPSRTKPRWKEQFGRVLIEAGACGIPVVGSDSGEIPTVVDSAGMTFPEGDIDSLAKCIDNLQSNPDACRSYGQVGLTRSREVFSWQRVAEQMRDAYLWTTSTDRSMDGGGDISNSTADMASSV